MSALPMTLNGLRAIGVRLLFAWSGVWSAEVTLDPDIVATAPTSGPAILVAGGVTMKGTIDPRGSSTFATKAGAVVVGGQGGWDTSVPAQHFHNPGGTLSTLVYTATAALVQEIVSDPLPELWGEDVPRIEGPAKRVFRDRDWHVDPITGITLVAPWPPAVLDPTSTTILDWDPVTARASISADSLVLPGTVLVDSRFNGATYTIRDVEQVFDSSGSQVTAWCASSAVSRLTGTLVALVRDFAGTARLGTYRYRFVLPEDPSYGKLALQAITPAAPDLNPVAQWTGLSGIVSKIAPGTEIVVGFTADDPPTPYLVSFSPLTTPLQVDIAGGAAPVALAPGIVFFLGALQTWSAAVAGALSSAGFPITAAQAALVAAIGSAATATPAILTRAT